MVDQSAQARAGSPGDPEASRQDHAGHRARRRSFLSRAALLWSAVWLLVAGLVVVPHIFTLTALSHIDEYQHVDYLDKVSSFEVVNPGEKVGETAMREQACRGMDLKEIPVPPCNTEDFTPEMFPGAGFNHTYGDPPGYYVVTAPVAGLVLLVPGVDSLVTAGRAVGVLWLAGGLGTTFLLALRLGATRTAAAGGALLLASTPAVVHPAATITTDAPAMLVGGLLCLTAVAVVRGRLAWWWLALAAALTTAMKTTSLTVVGAVLVFLLLDLFRRSSPRGTEPGAEPALDGELEPEPSAARRPRTVLLHVGALLGGAAIPAVLWAVVTKLIETPAVFDIPMRAEFAVDSLRLSWLGDNLLTYLTPVRDAWIPPFMKTDVISGLMGVLNILLIIGVVALGWYGRFAAAGTRLAIATLVSMLASGPGFVVLLFVSAGANYWLPLRYGLSLLPAAAACLAVVASRRRSGGVGLVALGAASLLALLSQTL